MVLFISKLQCYRNEIYPLTETEFVMSDDKHYIYILQCADSSLYTGYTNDLEKRLKAHNDGKGAKYTKSRLPVEMVYYEEFDKKEDAMSREWYIKHRLTREDKLELIKNRKQL